MPINKILYKSVKHIYRTVWRALRMNNDFCCNLDMCCRVILDIKERYLL